MMSPFFNRSPFGGDQLDLIPVVDDPWQLMLVPDTGKRTRFPEASCSSTIENRLCPETYLGGLSIAFHRLLQNFHRFQVWFAGELQHGNLCGKFFTEIQPFAL